MKTKELKPNMTVELHNLGTIHQATVITVHETVCTVKLKSGTEASWPTERIRPSRVRKLNLL